MISTRVRHILLLLALSLGFFLPGLGGVRLFDWDEINFAEISREMLILGDYFRVYVDFLPFWEKPPFFFWLQAGAMHLLGVGEFAARLPNAINGVLTVVVVYLIGSKLYNARFGLFWALAYFGSTLPFLYAKSGIIDPWFNLFIFLGLYGFILFYWKYRSWEGITLRQPALVYLLLGGLAIGFGILTKGPVAFLLAALSLGVYWVLRRFRWYVPPGYFVVFTLFSAIVMLAWYGLETWKNGPWFISEFNRYQYRLFSTPDAGHKGFPGYHVAVLLIGVFPASVFALRSFFRLEPEAHPFRKDFLLWMKILFWVVLVLFSIVQSKIVHYSSMAYLPMTYMAAVVIQQWWEGRISFSRWMQILLMVIGGLYALAVLVLPWAGMHIEMLEPLFGKDPFARGNLEADVQWTGWEALPGLLMVLVLFLVIRLSRRANLRWSIPLLFIGNAVFVLGTLFFTIVKIEGYSQAAAMRFFEERQGEEAYVRPLGYKSYGHLFYTLKEPVTNPQSRDQEWLLSGPIDKPAYFITKIHKTERLSAYPDIREIGRENGFVFYRREAVAR
jgi:hypothetical protein